MTKEEEDFLNDFRNWIVNLKYEIKRTVYTYKSKNMVDVVDDNGNLLFRKGRVKKSEVSLSDDSFSFELTVYPYHPSFIKQWSVLPRNMRVLHFKPKGKDNVLCFYLESSKIKKISMFPTIKDKYNNITWDTEIELKWDYPVELEKFIKF